MALRNVVVLADRPDRGSALAEAARTVSRCRVSGAAEGWADLDLVQGVIADMSLNRADTRHCLKDLSSRLAGQRMPLIYLMRTRGETELREAKQYGATACLSALTLPREVVTGLFRQIAPEKTMTDLLVEHSVDRAEALFTKMLDAARAGRIDPIAVDQEIDPILDALREGGLQRWLDLVQAHDDMTVRHCLLVAGLVANFAVHLKLSAVDGTALVRAGLVHDVGKAQIPLKILNKPGPLDADEMAVMQTHAALGYEVLRASGMTDPIALEVTRHHHEMLDGSGYPDGLHDGQIGDAVRLLTICDIYAALTERRPYRSAMPQAQALPILRQMAPVRLEAALVQAFASSLADGAPFGVTEPHPRPSERMPVRGSAVLRQSAAASPICLSKEAS